MGEMNLVAILLAAAAFFAVTLVWYQGLFGKLWQREAGLSYDQLKSGNKPLRFALCFSFELLIALVLAHQFAMTGPSTLAIMLISFGFAVGVMVPAIGISYLFLRKSGLLFAIDAAHLVVGMTAMGTVFALLQ